MKQPRMASSYFRKVFRTVASASFLLLIITSAALFIGSVRSARAYLNAANQRFIENAASSIQLQEGRSMNNVLSAYISVPGVLLQSGTHTSMAEVLPALRDVDIQISQDAAVHSVYFYLKARDQVAMFGSNLTMSSLEDFRDRAVFDFFKTGVYPPSVYVHEAYNSNYSDSQTTVCTRTLLVPNGDVLVINLSADYLFKMFEGANSNNALNSFFIYADDGTLLYSKIDDPELRSVDVGALTRLLKQRGWASSAVSELGGRHVCINVCSGHTGWRVVSVMQQDAAYAGLRNQYLLFTVIILLCFALALFINYLVTSAIYRPVGSLQKLLNISPASGEDDFERISHQITDITAHLDRLHMYRTNSLAATQQALCKTQLLGSRYTDEEFFARCGEAELPFVPGRPFMLCLLRWFSESDQIESIWSGSQALPYAFSNVFHELFDARLKLLELPMKNDELVFLCQAPSPLRAGELDGGFERIRSFFREYFEMTASLFYIGGVVTPGGLQSAHAALTRLADYQYFYADGCVLDAAGQNSANRLSGICPLPETEKFESSLRSGDFETCRSLISSFFTELGRYNYESASVSVGTLVSHLISLDLELRTAYPELEPTDCHELYRSVTMAPTLALAQASTEAFLRKISASVLRQKDEAPSILIDKILADLETAYPDCNLSSKAIAKNYRISVAYLNHNFKQKTGETLPGYLKDLRLRQAHALLLSTDLSVEVIAQKVGFENTKYFYSIFKAQYGVSPSRYRLLNGLRNGSVTEQESSGEPSGPAEETGDQ